MKCKFESYKHYSAKLVLENWLKKIFKIEVEREFCLFGKVLFRPDITCFIENRIVSIYEVVYENDITGKKLGKIQMFQYYTGLNFNIYTIEAEWILKQIKIPKNLKVFDYSCFIT